MCGGGKKAAKPAATATTKPKPQVAPLTGMADPTGAASKRCAVTVKIDNTSASQPKYGVNLADVVYEEVVEGGYTRLAAIFNSHAPEKVGSVRSVRLSDHSLVWPFARHLRLLRRRASTRSQSINTAPVVRLDETSRRRRDVPRSLAATRRSISTRNVAADVRPVQADPAPPPLFLYRASGAPTPAARRCGRCASASSAASRSTWTWDAASGTWMRSIFGAAGQRSRRACRSRRRTWS